MGTPDWKARVDPELRGLLRMLPFWTFGPRTTRMFRRLEALIPSPRPRRGLVARTERVGSRALHLFHPKEGVRRPGAVLWIHSGGLILGKPQYSAPHCMRLAERVGVLVAAAEYRLAPQHPYPAALDDCVAAFRWLVEHADALGFAPDRIVVAGESAGGGLAANLAQRLHDEGGVQPAGQLLVYPMLDDRTATREELTRQRHLVWNNESNNYGWSSYLQDRAPGSPELPPYAAAARREDLTGLPPAWLTVGTLDLFYEEDLAYAERLREAGVPVELDIREGGFHGDFSVGRKETAIKRTWDSLTGFVTRCVEAPPTM